MRQTTSSTKVQLSTLDIPHPAKSVLAHDLRYEVSTVLFREPHCIIPGWPQIQLAPASWQPYSLARVGHFGGVLGLRSSAWDRPRTASRTSAAAGLAWLVGRFGRAPRRGWPQRAPDGSVNTKDYALRAP